MSVYIKSMEMPECCDACSFAYWSNLHQTGSCDLLDGEQCFDDYSTDYIIKRSEHCPLIPVPPHGRLIDADEFLKRAIGTKCFRDDFALMLEELVGESTTIIQASEES